MLYVFHIMEKTTIRLLLFSVYLDKFMIFKPIISVLGDCYNFCLSIQRKHITSTLLQKRILIEMEDGTFCFRKTLGSLDSVIVKVS